jgi:glycosyltransferase involved in cell wall biosynthesis
MPNPDRPLRVALSTSVGQRGRSGVATYLFGLIDGLVRGAPDVQLTLVGLAGDKPLFARWLDRCDWQEVAEFWRPAVRDIFWHQAFLPGRLVSAGCDLVHIPSYRRVLARNTTPQVLTIHDCASFRVTGKYDAARLFYTKRVVVPLARRVRELITVSGATANDVVHFYGRPREKIEVVWNGIDHTRFRPAAQAEAPALEWPYFLYVARLEHPAKNHVRLIEAFEHVVAQKPDLPHRLVLAGADWHGAEAIHARIAASAVRGRIVTPGFVKTEALAGWYAGAEAMLYPSLFEGFGLPPIEAMACGCPVACSGRGSLEEVVGDAARLVNPDNSKDIADSMLEMMNQETRERWRARGLKRAALFDWLEVGKQTAAVYRRAARTS